jgi:hypothetical protein
VTPLLYLKLGAIVAMVAALFAAGYHIGGMASRSAYEADTAAQSQAIATAVLAERASALATAAADHATEAQHAKTIIQIDAAPPIRTPVFLCAPGGPLRAGALPGTEAKAGGIPADPAEGRSQPVDRGSNIRPAIEELKKRLEKVTADYRQLDAEWPK